MSEPMSEERILAILGSVTAIYLAAPESVADDITAKLLDCLSEIDRQSADIESMSADLEWANCEMEQFEQYENYRQESHNRELADMGRRCQRTVQHFEEQIDRLKDQLQQQSDYVARLESQQKGGFW